MADNSDVRNIFVVIMKKTNAWLTFKSSPSFFFFVISLLWQLEIIFNGDFCIRYRGFRSLFARFGAGCGVSHHRTRRSIQIVITIVILIIQ